MKNFFPAQGQSYTYLQTNRSDSLGSLFTTMGADFQSDLGTFRLAPRLMTGTTTASVANLGLPVAFDYWDSTLWAIGGTRVFSNTSTANTPFAQDASTGAQTNYSSKSDLAIFNSRLWSTTDTGLYSKAADGGGTGAWTNRTTTGWNANADHILTYFPVFNRLYYQPAAGLIGSIDISDAIATTDYTLILPAGTSASCMIANSTYIWLGISANANVQGSIATVYQWDGISSVPTKVFTLKSRYIQAMTLYEDIVYIIDGNGVLSKFNGYTFDEIGRLPYLPEQPAFSNFVQRNGMISTRNATIEVLVDNLNGDGTTTYENIPSGIWEWSQQFGFTQKNVFTYYPNSGGSITDYGQNKIQKPGALFDVSAVLSATAGRNGNIIAGATYFTDATNTTNAIFFDDSNDTIQKKGYFVTTWFFSNEIQDKWNRLWAIFKRFLGATDSIVFKFRLYEETPVVATITWVDTLNFTTATDVTAYSPTATGFNGTSGGEVEILNGKGGASCAHIINIVQNGGTYTVTLDTPITGVSGTAVARFQKWIKMFPELTGQVLSYGQMAINKNNTRIQIKGCLTFTSDGEFNKFGLFSNEDITITP